MRKSPFSTPRGNGNSRPGFGWKSSGSPGRGYGRPKNLEYYSPIRNQNSSQSSSDDFIPFNANGPSPRDRKFSGNWSSPSSGNWLSPGRGNYRNSSSPGFNNFGNNTTKDNQRQSPYYKNGGNSFRGNRKNFHRGNNHQNVDISSYVNLRSFLEDPWADLLKKISRNASFQNSANESLSDFSFGSSVFDVVHLNDSAEADSMCGDLSSREETSGSFPLSQESVNISSGSSSDPKTSQDTRD
ncbi:probable ATP-dependent RNA helicase ddx42 [Venturia canescens]|uniref:probable ATP-dependent RNA helicase ddx42 n=1 Tax=Venturia canescens TaxID=32260 RepID=UPI001C9D2AE2|nr:probable ATP-dependent RNA helicase ddx42 [Venturia canescens]